MNAFVVSGLVKRRAELAGEIERTHEPFRKMVLDLENLDATILQFKPDFKVEAIKPKAFRPPTDLEQPGPNVPDHSHHPSPSRRTAHQSRYRVGAFRFARSIQRTATALRLRRKSLVCIP
jgi:hypothetical protein